MIRRLALAFAIVALAACTPQPAADAGPMDGVSSAPVQSTPASSERPQTAEACAAAGGSMVPVCRRQIAACVRTFSDAGKPCRTGTDCQGDCVAEGEVSDAGTGASVAGVCAANDNPCGCRTVIEDGKARPTICVD